MTEDQAMKKMESAISELTRHQPTPVPRAVTPSNSLDAGRLMELARDRLTYARQRLAEVKRDHTLKLYEIDTQYLRKVEEAQREREQAVKALEEQTTLSATAAKDMIDLVEKMLA